MVGSFSVRSFMTLLNTHILLIRNYIVKSVINKTNVVSVNLSEIMPTDLDLEVGVIAEAGLYGGPLLEVGVGYGEGDDKDVGVSVRGVVEGHHVISRRQPAHLIQGQQV